MARTGIAGLDPMGRRRPGVIVTILTDAAAVETVHTGPEGVLAACDSAFAADWGGRDAGIRHLPRSPPSSTN